MQAKVYLRFYEELNDYLPPDRRKICFTHAVQDGSRITDVLRMFGVALDEIELILVNGESVDLAHPLQDGDRVSIYPVFEALDITSQLQVRSRPLREIRFIVDTDLGKLAKYLRMLGFDTLYQNDYEGDDLVALSRNEKRVLLSKDGDLMKRSRLSRAYEVRATTPRQQLVEVLARFDLFGMMKPFDRCLRCNARLAPVRKQDVIDRLTPETAEHYDQFWLCPVCRRLYWEGSHLHRMNRFVQEILAQGRASQQKEDV